MVFQPTSPVKSFAVVQRAATVTKKPNAEASVMASNVSSTGEMAESVPSDLSQAETQRASRLSTATSSTGGRNRSSWHRMSRLFQKSSEALHTENKLTKPNPNARPKEDDSPTDPMYDPQTRTFRAELPARERRVLEKRISKETTKSPVDTALKGLTSSSRIEMPPIAITGPDEPKSFLDLDSSSDEESPVVQRASSVRVSKPQIVRHNSSSAARVPKISESTSAKKPEQSLGQEMKKLYDLAANEREESSGGPADALKILESADSVDGSTDALPPTPPSRTQTPKEGIKATIVEAPNVAGDAETTPTSDMGIRSQGGSLLQPNGTPASDSSVFNPLRANPLSDVEREHTRLARTMSAPLPPNRNPNRRVTIRPADLIIHHTEDGHRLFRESIVTTPYPNRLSMVNESNENRLSTALNEKQQSSTDADTLTALPEYGTEAPPPLSITPTPIEQKSPVQGDRFPSPSHTEHLFLTLSLPTPSTASTTVEIEIEDRATFDDEHLFVSIRRAYHWQLLGIKRRAFFSRKISHVLPGSNDMHLDGPGFIAHLYRPSLGRKKKGWLIWLRNQQPIPKRASSMFSGHGGGQHHHSHTSSESSNMSAYWSPVTHNGVPRMPFSRVQARDLPPRVIIHYRFSVLAVLLALVLVGFLSVLSTILWVLFGVPGQAAGENAKVTLFGSIGWQREAEFRGLTGLVLGLVVGLSGTGAVGGWCWGGQVLL